MLPHTCAGTELSQLQAAATLDAASVALPQETAVFVLHTDSASEFTGKISDPGGFTDSLPGPEPGAP